MHSKVISFLPLSKVYDTKKNASGKVDHDRSKFKCFYVILITFWLNERIEKAYWKYKYPTAKPN